MKNQLLFHQWQQNAHTASNENKRFVNQRTNQVTPDWSEQINTIHDAVFSEINCLDCGNCCKSVAITLTQEDQKRINTFLGKDVLTVIPTYHFTETNEVLVQTVPCPFLNSDNACSIYEVRPEVCRAYPFIKGHAIQKNVEQLASNTRVCPATYHILERLKVQSKLLM